MFQVTIFASRDRQCVPCYRCNGLTNPTNILGSLLSTAVCDNQRTYDYVADSHGRKFLRPYSRSDL